jgi:hypothetical protein
MKDHGVDVPGRGSGAAGGSTSTPPSTINRDDPAYKAADDICRALLPATPGSSGSAPTTSTQP